MDDIRHESEYVESVALHSETSAYVHRRRLPHAPHELAKPASAPKPHETCTSNSMVWNAVLSSPGLPASRAVPEIGSRHVT